MITAASLRRGGRRARDTEGPDVEMVRARVGGAPGGPSWIRGPIFNCHPG
jgi:hypothetical protein